MPQKARISLVRTDAKKLEEAETWDHWEMRIHKRLIDLDASDRALRQLMRIQVPDGVNIEIVLRS